MSISRAASAFGVAVLLVTGAAVATASSASADTTCTGDICVVDNTVATPVGPATVTVSATNVVTVQLAPTTRTAVFGIPFAIPPGPPGLPGYARTTVSTPAGVINIDTVVIPPGPPGRFALPNLAVVSIHPPGPCRVQVVGTTVTFTPITVVIPPGPPG
jgi:hypothetical protein